MKLNIWEKSNNVRRYYDAKVDDLIDSTKHNLNVD